MRIERTQDILEHARTFHRMIAEGYHRLGTHETGPRIRMLLDYLETHEKHLEETLVEYEIDAAPKVLKEWFRQSPCEMKFAELRTLLTRDTLTELEIIGLAVDLDDCMIDMYRHLAQHATSDDVRAMFQDLMVMEENEKRRMVRDAMRMQDM